MAKYENLPTVPLSVKQAVLSTDRLPEIAHLDDPALAVMLDLTQTAPHTIGSDAPIDDALNEMKLYGVHLLFVLNKNNQIEGIIASEDILGELPIKITQERRIPRSHILTHMIMLPLDRIIAFDIDAVSQAKVGHIVNTLKSQSKHYALVIKTNQDKQVIRGIFTTSQISRQLHMDIANTMTKPASVSDLRKQQEES